MAYQTSCASYTSGRVGLSSATAVVADAAGREQTQHGSPLFPIACYAEDLSCFSVAWHWHEEFEFILAALGPIHVDVNKTRLTLQTGQGVFINSGALHAVEPAEGRALLHSGVFQPRLIGGMDTVFWQKLIRPLLQPGTPPFFLLDEAVPWQRQVLLCLREAWKGVADEPFDYENRVRYHLTAALRLLITQCVSGKVKVSEQEQIASERMKQMLRYVEEHYTEELTVEKLAGCVALSESACLRSFRQFLGITPIQYVKNFTQPIQQLAQVSNMLQSMTAAAERVFEFLNEPEEDQLADPARRADPACIDGQVTFDHVKFGYTPEKTVIHNFSCNVKPGQKVAIVGPTGAGKTTMVKLLMRFYDVDSGEILLNGHNVRDFDRSDLREGFGMVLQDTWLFKGTIMENIRYGRLDATDEEVIAAAKAANADHFIRTLPGGYQMELNEDASNVSQGQKQLLTIARTILADNRILILDEATSSVDTRTEQRIQTAMDRLMEGRTSFVIAHRLSTIRDADLILVMRDGDIVEQGTHDQLIEAGGFYADLYNSQFEDVVD